MKIKSKMYWLGYILGILYFILCTYLWQKYTFSIFKITNISDLTHAQFYYALFDLVGVVVSGAWIIYKLMGIFTKKDKTATKLIIESKVKEIRKSLEDIEELLSKENK